jgi:hypothetical protein
VKIIAIDATFVESIIGRGYFGAFVSAWRRTCRKPRHAGYGLRAEMRSAGAGVASRFSSRLMAPNIARIGETSMKDVR